MDASTWINVGLLVVAIVAAIAAFWQAAEARRARVDAQSARSGAEGARDESQRIATALERANEIAEASRHKASPSFTFRRIGRDRWKVENNGDAVAEHAYLEKIDGMVIIEDDQPRDVGPGDSLAFHAMRSGIGSPRLALVFTHQGQEVRREFSPL